MRRRNSALRTMGTIIAVGLLLAGCTRLDVRSNPPGASVLWSADGRSDWRPWPPRAWAEASDDPSSTPLKTSGSYGDTLWITVEKEGYYRPLPRAAQLYTFRNEKLEFELVETPAARDARLRASGLVEYKNEWVNPAEKGLVEYRGAWITKEEAFALDQRAKGLVEYAGAWVTPAERDQRFAADQRAKGLQEFKGRWVTAEVRDQELKIDSDVRQYSESTTNTMSLPKVIGPIDASTAQMQILNSSGQTVRFLISGPQSRELILKGYESFGLRPEERLVLEPGRYIFAAIPAGATNAPTGEAVDAALVKVLGANETFPPAYVESTLAPGFQYMLGYEPENALTKGEIGDYKLEEPTIPYEVPTITIPEIKLPERQAPAGMPPGARRGGMGNGGGTGMAPGSVAPPAGASGTEAGGQQRPRGQRPDGTQWQGGQGGQGGSRRRQRPTAS